MRYLCLVYHEQATVDALSEREHDAVVAEVLAYREELRQSGHDIASSPLHPAPSATTIRVRHGEVTVTQDPGAETREQLAGFYLVEARDLNDAIRVAARMPPAHLGCIEIRPLKELDPPDPSHVRQGGDRSPGPDLTPKQPTAMNQHAPSGHPRSTP